MTRIADHTPVQRVRMLAFRRAAARCCFCDNNSVGQVQLITDGKTAICETCLRACLDEVEKGYGVLVRCDCAQCAPQSLHGIAQEITAI